MNTSFRVDLGQPALLRFSGPDAERFLNGQLTQDVKLASQHEALPSCVTDAKGKLQFRVYLTQAADGSLLVSAPEGTAEALEARLTRYLISDDAEVEDLSEKYRLQHVIGAALPAQGDAFARKAARFGVPGEDFWIPADQDFHFPEAIAGISDEDLEAFRIRHGAPVWGRELTEGLLPPEAGLDRTDISYHKGCYIGQEVISRIRSAGKLNRTLLSLKIHGEAAVAEGAELFSDEMAAGVLTSISPVSAGGWREAMGYVKRSANRGGLQVRTADGQLAAVELRCDS